MPRYRKRPIVVEAEQWFPGRSIPGLNVDYRNNEATVVTIQGVVTPVTPGEWVIQEGDGVHAYPCDPVMFKRIYEPCPAMTSAAKAAGMMLAEVVFSMGRCHLKVGGFYLATEGDKCRESLPEEVLPPIPREELDRAIIGGKPASDLPIEMVRWFRGDPWDERMMRYVADEINKQVSCPAATDPAPASAAEGD